MTLQNCKHLRGRLMLKKGEDAKCTKIVQVYTKIATTIKLM